MKTWWIGIGATEIYETQQDSSDIAVVEYSEYEKLKKENEVLKKAVKAISARKTIAVYSYSEEFIDGSNTAFAQAAEIADEALEQADKIRGENV